MKLSMINILNEGLSDIVYHFTYPTNLVGILRINKFATSSNLGSTADFRKDKGKFYFFSTQRTKGMSGYGSRHGTVAIVLNGRKLNQTYKGFPTDYWNWSKKRADFNNINDYINALKSSELEDRIVTDKPYIDNANNYILEIHIEAKSEDRNLISKENLDEIQILTQKYNIPTYFYADENNFKLQNKNKAVTPENLGIDPKEKETWDVSDDERDEYNTTWFFKKIAPIIIVGNEMTGGYNDEKDAIEKLLKDCLERYNRNNQYDNVMTDINDKVKRISTSWGRFYGDDEYNVLSAEIHNNRGNPNPYLREILKMIVADMKKWRKNNFKEYVVKKLNYKL